MNQFVHTFYIRPNKRFHRWRWLLLAAIVVAGIRLWPKPRLADYHGSSIAVYDANGRLLRLTLARDDRYRLWLPLERISPDIAEAFLLKEDRWFYWHPGVNPFALIRGAWRTYVAGGPRAGGSTITMQLARLTTRESTRTPGGKLRQIGRALKLELLYSKREILEAYLNLVPCGANIEGVGAASLIYFGKPAETLALPETLTLAVIPQAPARRGLTRGAMIQSDIASARGHLFGRWVSRHPSDADQRNLIDFPLNLRGIRELPFLAPHAVDSLVAEEFNDGPHEVHATLDLALQRLVERQIRGYVDRHRRIGIENATALLVDYRSMEVKALVGSADFFNAEIAGQVNGVAAKRSPGSTLKPFIYALAMDQGLIHPMSVLKDTPAAFGPFSPENFDGGFAGPISARDALIRSRNVPAVALTADLSAPSLYEFLVRGGVVGLAPERYYGLTLALGAGDVSMQELATLYAVLANRGVWRPLRLRAGEKQGNETRLLSEEASFMTLDILQGNLRPEGVTVGARAGRPVAWKTGTSFGFRDAWSAGVFGRYVLVVWIGNFSGAGNPAFVGVQAAGPLFFQVVDAIRAEGRDVDAPEFDPPPQLARVEVCAASGDLPNADCPLMATTWFIPGKSPIRVSNVHRRVAIDTRTERLACQPYDGTHVRHEVFEYWPSDVMRLFAEAGMPRRAPPAGDCAGSVDPGAAPVITAPLRGAAYVMRDTTPERNWAPLSAAVSADVASVYWFVDDSFVAAAKAGVTIAWKPKRPGRYRVRVVDDHGRADGRELVVRFEQ
jgi:penicillin-binding protein 1C